MTRPRRLIPALLVLTAVFCSPGSAFAQQQRPVVTVCSAGIARALQDVDYLARIADRPAVAQFVNGLLAGQGNLTGIDRDRPIALMFYMSSERKPRAKALLAVPIDDMTALQSSLTSGGLLSLAPAEISGWYTLTTPKKILSVRVLHRYAFVSESKDLLEGELGDPAPQLQMLTEKHDVCLTLDRSGIADDLVARFHRELDQRLSRDLTRRETESDVEFLARTQTIRLLSEAVHIVVDGFTRAEVGLNVSENQQDVRLTARLLAAEGSVLSEALPAWNRATDSYARVARQAAFRLEVNAILPEGVRELVSEVVEIAAREFDANVGQSLRQEDQAPVMGAFQTLAATARSGDLQLLAAFVPNSTSHMSLLLSGGLKDAQGLREAIRTVLPYAQQGGDIKNLVLDLEVISETSVHRFQGESTRQQDRRLYGPDPSVFLAIGAERVWLAAGTPAALPMLREAITSAVPVETTPALLTAELHMLRWLPLIEAEHKDAKIIAALHNAFDGNEHDRIEAELTADTSGLALRLAVDEGYLKLIGDVIGQEFGKKN